MGTIALLKLISETTLILPHHKDFYITVFAYKCGIET